jgi:hypothetical protein
MIKFTYLDKLSIFFTITLNDMDLSMTGEERREGGKERGNEEEFKEKGNFKKNILKPDSHILL